MTDHKKFKRFFWTDHRTNYTIFLSSVLSRVKSFVLVLKSLKWLHSNSNEKKKMYNKFPTCIELKPNKSVTFYQFVDK